MNKNLRLVIDNVYLENKNNYFFEKNELKIILQFFPINIFKQIF